MLGFNLISRYMSKSLIFFSLLFGIFLYSCGTTERMTNKIIYLGSETKTCDAGVIKKECYQVKWTKNQEDWEYFYNEIQGFEYEEGYFYTLKVKVERIDNPPADASSLRYHLIKELEKKKVK